MKLIDKDAIVAEIETRYNECLKRAKIIDAEYWNGKADAYRDILVALDALEAKEVDLEKVFNDEYSKFSNDVDAMDYGFPIDLADYKDFAKHFFELALSLKNS